MDFKSFLKGETDTVPLPKGGPPPLPSQPKKLSSEEVLMNAVDKDPEADNQAYDYDLLVIGGGSGGLSAVKRACDHGANVALCDFVQPSPAGTKWGLGGTCVNVGCIPKKLMHTAALQGEQMKQASPSYGWSETIVQAQCDWETLKGNIDMYIRSINFGYTVDLRKKGIKYFNAFAKFVDNNTVEVVDKKGVSTRVTARRILLATGGRPIFPDIPGAREFGISSDDIFKLSEDPKKTLVVGASYVALECAGFLTGLGRETTVMMRSIPLRGFDQQMANKIVDHMEAHHTKFLKNCVPVSITKDKETGQLAVSMQNTQTKEVFTETYDTVLFAIGRKPETSSINLDRTNVKLSNSGHILVDAYERTTQPNIYAVGDIIQGGLELTPVAVKAGRHLADRLYNQGFQVMNYKTIPTTVFTPLEYGCVGLSEEDAIAQYGMVEVYHTEFRPLEWTVPKLEDNACYMKMIVNPFDNDKVLGFHVLSPNAGEITQGVAIAMTVGVNKSHFDDTVGIHPSIGEEMTTLRITKSSGESAAKGSC